MAVLAGAAESLTDPAHPRGPRPDGGLTLRLAAGQGGEGGAADAQEPAGEQASVDEELPPLDAGAWEDPLRGCLPLLTALLDRAASAVSLTADLPLPPGALGPDGFVRALAQAGIRARVVKRRLTALNGLALPCVLLLKGEGACILTEIDGTAAEVLTPEMGAVPRKVRVAELARVCDGQVILAQVDSAPDPLAAAVRADDTDGWMRRAVLRRWPLYLEAAVALALANLLLLALPMAALQGVDRLWPAYSAEGAWVLGGGVALALAFAAILSALGRYFLDSAAGAVEEDVGERLFRHLLGLKANAERPSDRRLANRVGALADFRAGLASRNVATLVEAPFAAVFLFSLLLVAPGLLPAAAVACAGVLLALVLLGPAARRAAHREAGECDLARDVAHDAVASAEMLRTRLAEGRTLGTWQLVARHSGRTRMRQAVLALIVDRVGWIALAVAGLAAALLGLALVQAGTATLGAAAAGALLTVLAVARLTPLLATQGARARARVARSRIDEVVRMPVERPAQRRFGARLPALLSGAIGTVDLRDVSLCHEGAACPVLRDVSLRIGPGERVAVIGPAGAGKSTLARILLGLQTPTQGTVRIDATDIREIDPADLRQHIGYAPDDPVLVAGTVAENLRLGRPMVDADRIHRALRVAGADALVSRLAQGLDTQVGEGGRRLSPGERRAVALAGALVADAPLLVLDEPAAWMDERAEGLFRARLMATLGESTLVLFTRRQSMLSLVDRLIVLEEGAVVADGPTSQVLEKQSPRLVEWLRP